MKTLTLEAAQKMMKENNGNLDLHNSDITTLPNGLTVEDSLDLFGCMELTSLPDGLTVGGSLNLCGCTRMASLPDSLTVGGWLSLYGCTGLTSLSDNLTVGGWLNLRGCTGLTALPNGLTVGGSLNLCGCTRMASLPDSLTVGGWLSLYGCTGLTSLPNGLTVGGSLDLSGCTGLTALPNDLTVGGRLYQNGTNIPAFATKKIKYLHNGDYVEGQYLFADGILTHIKTVRKLDKYTLFVGKIPGKNVVYDGTRYAHCSNLREGIADLLFKAARDRGSDQYKGLPLDTEVSIEDAKTMYRVITGACRQGTESFVKSLRRPKAKYTIQEIIALTKGQYNAEKFERFFA